MLRNAFSVVVVRPSGGQYRASVVGLATLEAVRPTRDEAIAALESQLAVMVEAGELIDIEIGKRGLSGLAGKFRDDLVLRDICAEICQTRDADRPQ
ncbi:MAG: hypothetical protein JSS02_30785 [Planctomycetes bacterium]|nr:hypothetical protein [Planctomycetota bacterium]